MSYDAILIVSFGGPEGHDDVMPFLKNVAGDRVPEARLKAVAEHYHHFGGVSPINALTADLIDALKVELKASGPDLPVYWGNRFWRPMLPDAMQQMADDGVTRAVAFVTSAFGSPPGCRKYQLDIEAARQAVEGAPVVDKVRPFGLRDAYVAACADKLADAKRELGEDDPYVYFTAHSIPISMARTCDYEADLKAHAARVAEAAGISEWRLVWQSRSGPPHIPWLEPDICDALEERAEGDAVIVAPFGFIADHMEVIWDLDEEARQKAEELSLRFARAATMNDTPAFVRLVRDLIAEVVQSGPDPCPPDCCVEP